MDISPNNSRSKDNQLIKFGWLIEYETIIFFFKNCMKKLCDGKISLRSFSKKLLLYVQV